MSTTLNEDVIGRVRSVVATALKVDLDPVGAIALRRKERGDLFQLGDALGVQPRRRDDTAPVGELDVDAGLAQRRRVEAGDRPGLPVNERFHGR